ncbi:alpha-amylase family glycosyl hydrolase [Brevundimonas sp. SORGH_AS_0993]|uniref:alpha-amylase family glycosyl hydrolase n=1 Tax=Brevundimonas sp. SORGH_AS_0993 TaxID=3041794 RepID=UPI00277EA4F1|nr:alpha-amylase family glycosyl hydrolase [Brevundimonas sp. SORGH_AS_0993]MDQ1155440.1 glycosidase [Brevundimonas sp. SORGH_AS_0993]
MGKGASLRKTVRGMSALAALLVAVGTEAAFAQSNAAGDALSTLRQRPPQDEVIYFLLPDRFANGDRANDHGGYPADRLKSGFDPADTDFYHGGDLAGITQRLDYIQGLGATAVWLAPIFKNKPVQTHGTYTGAAHHGYWITDFTTVDPHFGTEAEMRALVQAAHARGMKVYLDIVANHTADVIRYRECPQNDCAYRSRADYPYTRRGGLDGVPINDGFDGEDFSRLIRSDYAYTPYVPAGEETLKVPAWLNDPIHYHNRGESTFAGESGLDGDFAGLDDLFTEDPVVIQGMIEVFGGWIDKYGIDGYRIDTARHVDSRFWQAFIPAMLERARAKGIPNFHIFGEVYDPDPAVTARFTRIDAYPAVLDFPFQKRAVEVAAGKVGTDALATLFAADALYDKGAQTAAILPTFLGNHDMGRVGFFVKQANPNADDAEILARVKLAHALMMVSRGVPTLYYGDEQGFAGAGGYGNARQDMWPGRTPVYAAETPVGGRQPAYSTEAPLYVAIAEMARLRAAEPALRRGRQVVRASGDKPGLFALSRLGENGSEVLAVFNTSTAPIVANVEVEPGSLRWQALRGDCAPASSAPASVRVSVPPLDYLVCKSVP